MARTYIADCKGFTTGEFTARDDIAAAAHARAHFGKDFTNGLVEVWDVYTDQLTSTFRLEDPVHPLIANERS